MSTYAQALRMLAVASTLRDVKGFNGPVMTKGADGRDVVLGHRRQFTDAPKAHGVARSAVAKVVAALSAQNISTESQDAAVVAQVVSARLTSRTTDAEIDASIAFALQELPEIKSALAALAPPSPAATATPAPAPATTATPAVAPAPVAVGSAPAAAVTATAGHS